MTQKMIDFVHVGTVEKLCTQGDWHESEMVLAQINIQVTERRIGPGIDFQNDAEEIPHPALKRKTSPRFHLFYW